MTTRFKTNSKKNLKQPPLPSGYEKESGTPEFTIPSCGVEDVDVAMFNLFEKEIVAHYGGTDSSEIKKVPVIFAAGEKWALLKGGRPIRDRNNTLILPLITIMRSEVNQTSAEDVAGRGINQQVGEIVVRRKLDKSDRDYQNLINRLFVQNQSNVSGDKSVDPLTSTTRKIGELSNTWVKKDGALLTPNTNNNIYETIVVPTPQFYTAKYQITVWTQYMQHANQIIEKIFSTLLPQAQSWRLDTPKGYWFVAKVEDGSFTTETNFDDMSQQERYIKHTFNVSVPAYFFVPDSPGAPIAIKRYVSSPTIVFDAGLSDPTLPSEPENGYVLGSDDPTLPPELQPNRSSSQFAEGWRPQKTYPVFTRVDNDFDRLVENEENGNPDASRRGALIKVTGRSSKGETTYSGASLGGLEIVITK